MPYCGSRSLPGWILALLAFMAPATILDSARGELPDGEFRVRFSGSAAIPTLPNFFFACEDSGELLICYYFKPMVDLRGRITGSVEVEINGSLKGIPIAGALNGALSGKMRGSGGDGAVTQSSVRLIIAAEGVVAAGGEERGAAIRARFGGPFVDAGGGQSLAGFRKLAVAGLGSLGGQVDIDLDISEPVRPWALDLSIAADGERLAGIAALTRGGGQVGEYTLRGKFIEKKQMSKIALKPGAGLEGSAIKILDLVLSPDGSASFEARYKLFGHRGTVHSDGGSAEWMPVRDSEGAVNEPIDLTGLLPYEGSVGSPAQSYYIIRGLDPDSIYTIALERLDSRPYPIVPPPVGFGSIACGWNDETPGALIECATATRSTGEIRFQVQAFDGDAGGRFRISVVAGGIINQGTDIDPLEVAQLPFRGGALSQSYYVVTGLFAGASYSFRFEDVSANGAAFWLFDTPGFDQQLCIVRSDLPVEPPCSVRANAEGKIYILATALENSNVEYTFTLESGGIPNEGTITDPVDITSALPYSGSVGIRNSYYRIDGLIPNAPYTVAFTDITDSLRLVLYGSGWHLPNKGVGCFKTSSGPSAECVSRTDAAGSLWIEVRGFDTAAGATFKLAIAPGGLPNEGFPQAPFNVTGGLPRACSIYNGPSVYKVTGLSPSKTYKARISGLSEDLNLIVYGDGDFQDARCFSMNLGTEDETCMVTAPEGELYLWVTFAHGTEGSMFTLTLE